MSCTPDKQFQNVPTLLQSVSPLLMWWPLAPFRGNATLRSLSQDSVTKRFWVPERKKFFYIKLDYGILIQESDYSDFNIARFQRSGELPMTFATQS